MVHENHKVQHFDGHRKQSGIIDDEQLSIQREAEYLPRRNLNAEAEEKKLYNTDFGFGVKRIYAPKSRTCLYAATYFSFDGSQPSK